MSELIVLRLIHVVGGIFWVGAGLFNFIYLMPALAAAGPAAGPIMGVMERRKLFVVLPTVAVLTILSGLRLLWLTSGFTPAYFESGPGMTFSAAGGAAILAFLIGITLAMPAQKRMATLGPAIASATDDAARSAAQAEMARLQARTATVGKVVTLLLVIAAIGMAIARYVG